MQQTGTSSPCGKAIKRSTSGVRRSKIGDTGGQCLIWRPGGGIILDTRTYPLQTGSHSASLSAAQVSGVPGRLLYTGLRHSQTTSFTVSHPTSPDRTTLLTQHFRLSGLLCSRSDSLNSLPDALRDPALSSNSFRQSLKTNLLRRYHSAHTAQ